MKTSVITPYHNLFKDYIQESKNSASNVVDITPEERLFERIEEAFQRDAETSLDRSDIHCYRFLHLFYLFFITSQHPHKDLDHLLDDVFYDCESLWRNFMEDHDLQDGFLEYTDSYSNKECPRLMFVFHPEWKEQIGPANLSIMLKNYSELIHSKNIRDQFLYAEVARWCASILHNHTTSINDLKSINQMLIDAYQKDNAWVNMIIGYLIEQRLAPLESLNLFQLYPWNVLSAKPMTNWLTAEEQLVTECMMPDIEYANEHQRFDMLWTIWHSAVHHNIAPIIHPECSLIL